MLGEVFQSITANLSEVTGMVTDPLGLDIGDVDDVEAAARDQEVTTGTFGAMQARFDGPIGTFVADIIYYQTGSYNPL